MKINITHSILHIRVNTSCCFQFKIKNCKIKIIVLLLFIIIYYNLLLILSLKRCKIYNEEKFDTYIISSYI